MPAEQSVTAAATNLEPRIDKVDARDAYLELRKVDVFTELREADAACLGEIELIHAPQGAALYREGESFGGFWGVVEGAIRGFKREEDGSRGMFLHCVAGESYGEVPLLTGRKIMVIGSEVLVDTTLVHVPEEGFWNLMATCPVIRGAVLANMGRHLQNYQAFALHREKLISLGTLAAGLMHELNNPGTAARRAATQLRENLVSLQQISLRYCETPMQDDQLECLKELQKRALGGEKARVMSAIDQSDAEECLSEWLDAAGVENSWKMAPTLTAIGLTKDELGCTRHAFEGGEFSDALNWLVSLVSSMQLVGTIEESITRISELVIAVKKYSYNETATQTHAVDIHDGLLSTVTILGHKLRPKDLKVDRQFAASLPVIQSRGAGLTQVWTNLLDNAVDASPERGTIHLRTWVEGGDVCVGIADEGQGIAPEHQEKVFDPFFTTKPVGVGTGLGLDIAQRIVVGSYGGKIGFSSRPGWTEFVIRIPIGSQPS